MRRDGSEASPPLLFGTAQLGVRQSRSQWQQLVQSALASGFTGLDTAPSYSDGLAERVTGAVLKRRPVPVQTKVGLRRRFPVKGLPRPLALAAAGLLSGRPGWDDARTLTAPEQVRRQWEGSKRRLGVDRVDVLLLHEPDPQADLAGVVEVVLELRRRGLVREVGVAAPWATCRSVVARHPDAAQVVQMPAADVARALEEGVPDGTRLVVHSLVSWVRSGAAGPAAGRDLPLHALEQLRAVVGDVPVTPLVATTNPVHATAWADAARRTASA